MLRLFRRVEEAVSDRLEAQPAQERAFLQSVVYAALFDYPLTLEQLRESLIGELADERTLLHWYQHSDYLQATVDSADGYFFPRGRRDLLITRARSRANESRPAAPALGTAHLDHAPAVRADGGALREPRAPQRRRRRRSRSLRRHRAAPRVDRDGHHACCWRDCLAGGGTSA